MKKKKPEEADSWYNKRNECQRSSENITRKIYIYEGLFTYLLPCYYNNNNKYKTI